MSWLSSFANAENAAALFKQAVSTVESKIDQVLDIPGSQQPTQSSPSSQPGTSPSSPKVRDPGRSPRLGASSPSPKRASNTQQPSNPQPPSKSRTGSTDKGPRLNIHDRLSALAATKAANSSSQPPIKAGPSATQSPIPANVPAEPSPIAPSTIASKPESPLVELTDSPPKIDPAHVPLPTSSSSDPAVGWGLSPLEQEVSNVNLSEPLVANGHVTSQGVGPEVVAQPSTDPAETPSATETRLQVDESGPSRVVNTVLEWSSSPSLPEGSMQATDTQAGEVEISSEDLQRAISTRLPNESPSEESLAALAGEETLPASIQLVPDASSERNTKAASEADHIIPEMPTSAAEPVASSGKDSQLQVILEQREHQLMRSMQDNATLTDSLVSLKARVERMEEERQLEANEYEERIASLTEHNADLEQKIAISAKLNVEELAAKLEQKEELVAQLMSEGEKLSKAEFKANTTVKKLRAEKGDLEKQIKDLTAKIDGSAVETNALQIKLQHAQDSERKTQEASKSYKDAHERQSKELSKAQAELATVRSREGELEATLQRVRDELAEVRRLDHQTRSAAASEALAEQTKVVEELRGKLDASDRELERVQVAAQRELHDLRLALSQRDEDLAIREETYQRDSAALQARLRQAESRHNDLYAQGQESSRPLLRQIETLQSQHSTAIRQWEHLERGLTAQVRDAERASQEAQDRVKSLTLQCEQLTKHVRDLQQRCETAEAASSSLRVELQSCQEKLKALEVEKTKIEAECRSSVEEKERKLVQQAARFDEKLRTRLEEEKQKWESARPPEPAPIPTPASGTSPGTPQMARTASSRVDSESALPIPNTLDTPMTPASHPPAPFPTAFTRSSSTASASRLSLNMAGLPAANVGTPSTPSATLSAFINEAPSMSTAAMLERLRTAVKQYEGQMGSLQVQLQYAEQARQELENEVVRLTRENEDITVKLAQLEATDRSNKDLNARYDTLLELLGEKTERVEELQADIADMKAAFREQVQRLTEESARR